MMLLIGFGVVLACVFGSFVASGGAIGPLVASMPFELLTILGAAAGTFLMANSAKAIRHLIEAVGRAFKGPRYGKQDYLDLLDLLYQLLRLVQGKGIMAIESHIEEPMSSSVFAAFPRIRDDETTRLLICDYLRMIGMNVEDPFQLDEIMTRELKKNLSEDLHISHALQSIADALPALGIVAAVLGVIKTMASISKPPIVLGEMIAGALVGTFLGVLLAYGIVGPLAARIGSVVGEDAGYHNLIRSVLVAHLQGNPPQVAIEIGRKEVPGDFMPSFQQTEEALAGRAA
ncbi:flagellar motor stator protein MotA [Acidomonas methanolica]|uniref:Flagellar motor chemotaxis protein MotA n=1 Tax=Acidomonas methanolica NBRC 104435 TaxID=1231351 RepID=A0A023D4S2_ACIMT|nr:flagellar motor stator protein MotA [Acidomonas methanolica]MBU2653640.1 flagellar motor stator protein MotA [Acidomonas methanolica]TCS31592.1 chemotaxis protein MotA [Acidomonas methanolica]GAJ28806.1 flagellar motor chemotaxis protein MotA [Acidomonas methanolica NBRC 104435]GBQ57691.1 flagellar motor protein MotA [Acidomonas methanolica]GEK98010.1 flagellar motor protein MotA [Acidomonas methanolica NBRC 104435]